MPTYTYKSTYTHNANIPTFTNTYMKAYMHIHILASFAIRHKCLGPQKEKETYKAYIETYIYIQIKALANIHKYSHIYTYKLTYTYCTTYIYNYKFKCIRIETH